VHSQTVRITLASPQDETHLIELILREATAEFVETALRALARWSRTSSVLLVYASYMSTSLNRTRTMSVGSTAYLQARNVIDVGQSERLPPNISFDGSPPLNAHRKIERETERDSTGRGACVYRMTRLTLRRQPPGERLLERCRPQSQARQLA